MRGKARPFVILAASRARSDRGRGSNVSSRRGSLRCRYWLDPTGLDPPRRGGGNAYGKHQALPRSGVSRAGARLSTTTACHELSRQFRTPSPHPSCPGLVNDPGSSVSFRGEGEARHRQDHGGAGSRGCGHPQQLGAGCSRKGKTPRPGARDGGRTAGPGDRNGRWEACRFGRQTQLAGPDALIAGTRTEGGDRL